MLEQNSHVELSGNPRIVGTGAYELQQVEAVQQLGTQVKALNLQQGIDSCLDAKLNAVVKALDDHTQPGPESQSLRPAPPAHLQSQATQPASPLLTAHFSPAIRPLAPVHFVDLHQFVAEVRPSSPAPSGSTDGAEVFHLL